MSRSRVKNCLCTLYPPHQVTSTQQSEHLRIQALRQLTTGHVAPVVEGVAPVSLAQEGTSRAGAEHIESANLADRFASSRMAQDSRSDDEIFNQLADMVAATTISDGPPAHEAPNRLWTSRDAYQTNISSTIPSSVAGVSLSDLEHGVRSVFHSGLFGQATPATSRGGSRSVNHTGGRIHLTKSQRAHTVIQNVSDKAEALAKELRTLHPVDPNDEHALEQRYNFLDATSDTARSLSRSLSAVRRRKKDDYVAELATARGNLQELDGIISLLGTTLPPRTTTEPPVIETGHFFQDPLQGKTAVAQLIIFLGLACNLVLGLSYAACDFIISIAGLIAGASLEVGRSGQPKNPFHEHVLEQLPSTLYSSLNSLNLDGKLTVFAVCPSCSYCHRPEFSSSVSVTAKYPKTCGRMIIDKENPQARRCPCGHELTSLRHGTMRPKKAYPVASLEDHLARVLADEELERLCDKACDDAFASVNHAAGHSSACQPNLQNAFDGDFLRTFQAPPSSPPTRKLFIDRGDRARLALAMQVDFFNPNGLTLRGASDSLGIVSIAILNLPADMRYKPENIFMASIIPGPKEPDYDELPCYLEPIIDVCVVGWNTGIRLSRTASSPTGRIMDFAVVISVNDLPAARKVGGAAGPLSSWCTVCDQFAQSYNVTFPWNLRDVNTLRKAAEDYLGADTAASQQAIFDAHGVRWSEFWRLPYWNPTRMLVIDSMHCVLEGLVHYHCRHVLEIDRKAAEKKFKPSAAFVHPWKAYVHADVPPSAQINPAKDNHKKCLKSIETIHDLLQHPFESGEHSLTRDALKGRLLKQPKAALRFVAWSLGIHELTRTLVFTLESDETERSILHTPLKTKEQYSEALMRWRDKQPHPSLTPPRSVTVDVIDHIQAVIRDCTVPTWINTVPKRFGEAVEGTIKADEWRTLSTVYLPIAFITLFGSQNSSPREREVLSHTMALFQAVNILCRYSVSVERMEAYHHLLKTWVDGLHQVHPHTQTQKRRPNVHAAFHIFDFLKLFGPVTSWWTFPFERLIGTVQKINTNTLIGGEAETTIVRSFTRGSNLRKLLRHQNCPPIIREFKRLLDKALSRQYSEDDNNDFAPGTQSGETARYAYDGYLYTRQSTHLGNSLVRYSIPGSLTTTYTGSIQKIAASSDGSKVQFHISRYRPLPAGEYDPFSVFPWFPATSYSLETVSDLDVISPLNIVCHIAQLEYDGRMVTVDLGRQ